MKDYWPTRLAISGMLLALGWVHGQINSPDDWPFYYLSAAYFDALTVFLLGSFGHSRLIDDLININFVSIVVQATGYFTYFAYMPPTSYNSMLYTLIIIQWLRLLWVGPNEGHHVNNSRSSMVHNPNRLCW